MWVDLFFIITIVFQFRANDQDRTGDLILTMDVLYRLSYIGTLGFARVDVHSFLLIPRLRSVFYSFHLVASATLGFFILSARLPSATPGFYYFPSSSLCLGRIFYACG